MTNVKINEKYLPLYTTSDDLIIITGGRGSGKSFVVSDFACRNTFVIGEKILYTRYTLTSAKSSIIPEYKEKIELLKSEEYFKITDEEIKNKYTNSSILFKGIKNSSGNQTANLKSIKDPTKWILDEAEEMPDYNTTQKVRRSLRKKGAKIQTIFILNPSAKTHWIYKKYFKPNNIPEYFNGSVNGITYIHTTYLDNIDNLDESFIRDAAKTKIDNFREYENIFLGKWGDISDNLMFPEPEIKRFSLSDFDLSECLKLVYIDSADVGKDSFSAPYIAFKDGFYYVYFVQFNQFSLKINKPLTIDILKKENPEYCLIETNREGGLLKNDFEDEPELTDIRFVGIHNTINKFVRINAMSKFIIDHFVFLQDSEQDNEYRSFFDEITSYVSNEDNKLHDDAPDSIAGAAKYIKLKLM